MARTDDDLQRQRGPSGEEQVLRDPFWGVVRRHHPDLTLAVLPHPAAPPGVPDATSPADVDALVTQGRGRDRRAVVAGQ